MWLDKPEPIVNSSEGALSNALLGVQYVQSPTALKLMQTDRCSLRAFDADLRRGQQLAGQRMHVHTEVNAHAMGQSLPARRQAETRIRNQSFGCPENALVGVVHTRLGAHKLQALERPEDRVGRFKVVGVKTWGRIKSRPNFTSTSENVCSPRFTLSKPSAPSSAPAGTSA